MVAFQVEEERLVSASSPLPFVETVGWNEAAPPLVRCSKRWLIDDGFGPSIDDGALHSRGFRPARDQSPLHESRVEPVAVRFVRDEDDVGLGGSDVEAWLVDQGASGRMHIKPFTVGGNDFGSRFS